MGLYISNEWSSRLIELTSDLVIAGLERSAKFTHNFLNSDRYIIGPQHKSLSEEKLQFILKKMNFPEKFLPGVLSGLSTSNQCGLGFERTNSSSYRLYLEFFDRYKPDPLENKGLLHIGYKWQCDDPQKMRITRYSYAPFFNGQNAEQVVQRTLGVTNGTFIRNVVSAVTKSVVDTPVPNRIMTCATDESGCRRSFDVNVYRSGKKMHFLTDELENIGTFFKVDKPVLDSFIGETGSADIGHLSAGFNNVNDPFFTVYFDDLTPLINKQKINYKS